ncbi:MAG: hypothetical protein Q9167_005847 [Letrouitia subvulpina]
MERSPLLIAQTHARNASSAANPTAASEEHTQAAAHFAKAAKDSSDPEALRTLKLLEQHHEKLAQLLISQSAKPIPSITPAPKDHAPVLQSPPILSPQQPRDGSPYRSQQQNLPLPQRDISSSIASNLASARGIPSNRQKRNQLSTPSSQPSKNDTINTPRRSKPVEANYKSSLHQIPDSKPQADETQSTITPTSNTPSKATALSSTQSQPPPKSSSDETFQKFYSTFESLFSKLSAPLAFAGLPLIAENATEAPASNPAVQDPNQQGIKPSKLDASQRVSADPDYSKIFSRAALRAVSDEHGPSSVGATESFYVVPTSGGTMPYADILARQHGHHHHHQRQQSTASNKGDDSAQDLDDQVFVDARETPPSPPIARRRGGSGKTMEELMMDNQHLRAMVDQTARRLLEFEMGAQTSSLALQKSIRQLSSAHQSPGASQAGGSGSGGGGVGGGGGGEVEGAGGAGGSEE